MEALTHLCRFKRFAYGQIVNRAAPGLYFARLVQMVNIQIQIQFVSVRFLIDLNFNYNNFY